MKRLELKRYYKDKRDDLYKVISYDEDKCDYRMMKLDTFFYNIETLVVIHTDKVADYEFKEIPQKEFMKMYMNILNESQRLLSRKKMY